MPKFRDGRLHVYKQKNCRFWMCRFYAEGKYKTASTKETSFPTAKAFALDWYDRLRFGQRQGVPVHGKKFIDALKEYLDYQKTLIRSEELSSRQAKDYTTRLKGKLSFFNDYPIQSINLAVLNEYKERRLQDVSFNSIKHDFVALRQVLKLAKVREYIHSLPEFPSSSKKIKPNPRPSFSKEEWQQLRKASTDRINSATDKNKKYKREQLHDYMIWIVHCGTRVEETLRIKYGDVKIHKNESDGEEVRFTIDGKTGIRKVRGTIGAVRAYRRLCERHPKHKKTELLFPHNHKDGFNNLLNATNLKHDSHGRVRNAKSLRSTHIVYGIIRDISSKQIATNCGTSTSVIDKYYARFLEVDKFDDSFTALPKRK